MSPGEMARTPAVDSAEQYYGLGPGATTVCYGRNIQASGG